MAFDDVAIRDLMALPVPIGGSDDDIDRRA
jgi:hypothetical protein